MKKPTVVVFRRWKEGGVIALFPYESEGRGTCDSFEHIGQHGPASLEGVLADTLPACVGEPDVWQLLAELVAPPYQYQLAPLVWESIIEPQN